MRRRAGAGGGERGTPIGPSLFRPHRRVVRHPHGQAALGVVILDDAPGGQGGRLHQAGGAGGKGVPVGDLHPLSFWDGAQQKKECNTRAEAGRERAFCFFSFFFFQAEKA